MNTHLDLSNLSIPGLGFELSTYCRLISAVARNGVAIVISSPTRSGKTTTAAALVGEIERRAIIEPGQLPPVTKDQIDGHTLDLVQPDLDANQLVILTITANSIVDTVLRLKASGWLKIIGPRSTTILHQRLVRTVCLGCKKRLLGSDQLLRLMGVSDEYLERIQLPLVSSDRPFSSCFGSGCENCMGTGLATSKGVYEVCADAKFHQQDLHFAATRLGYRFESWPIGFALRDSALTKVLLGVIPLTEANRVNSEP